MPELEEDLAEELVTFFELEEEEELIDGTAAEGTGENIAD